MTDAMGENFDLPEPPVPLADGEAAGAFAQSDIDALFGDIGGAAPAKSGLRALVDSDAVGQERLPMLEVICDRLIRSFATSMRNLTSDVIEVSLDGVGSGRFGELMNRAPLPAMFGVFRVPEWDCHGVILVEPGLIYSVVDALLGGRRIGSGQPRVEGRPFTSIESSLVGRVMQMALSDFAAAFESVAQITMVLERIETIPRFAAIVGPSNITAQCNFAVDMEGRGGRFSILLPHSALEPVREKLMQRFMGEKPGVDGSWRAHFEREVRETRVSCRAIITERRVSLREVGQWAVGDVIALGCGPDDPLIFAVEGVPLASGQLGRRGPQVALRLYAPISGKGLS